MRPVSTEIVRSHSLSQSYQMTMARYGRMSLIQKKLGYLIMSEVSKFEGVDPENPPDVLTLTLTEDELNRYDITKGQDWRRTMRGALKGLAAQVVELPNNIKGNGREGWVFLHWITRAEFYPDRDVYELDIHGRMIPHFHGLKGFFVQLDLPSTSRLKHLRSLSLYPYLKKVMKLGPVEVPIHELREILGLEGAKYDWTDLRRKVLDKVQEDINANTDIRFKYRTKKRGRGRAVREVILVIENQPIPNRPISKRIPGIDADRSMLEKDYEERSALLSSLDPTRFKDFIRATPRSTALGDQVAELNRLIQEARTSG